jgi:predicted Zn-dependent peptidase
LYQKTTLNNGLRLITYPMPHLRSVSICIFIGTGSRYETDAEGGVSHFIEHLLFRGTEKRPTSREISAVIEGTGGILNGGTDKELTLYWCKTAQSHFPLALDVLVDMVLHSRFDPGDMEKERQVVIEEINMSWDSPQQRVNLLIDEVLWPEHPLGRDTAGTKESITAMSREALLNYMARQYQPGNTVVTIAGNIQHREALDAVSQALGRWTANLPRSGFLNFRGQQAKRVRIETRDTEQAHLCLALPALSLFDPRRFALNLLNVILGEGMSSRLFTEIRDKLGLCYSIHSHSEQLLDTGCLTIYAGVDPQNLEAALKAIMEQLSLLKETIPEEEISKAREMAKGRLLLSIEDSRSVAGWLGGQEVLTGRIYDVDEIISIIDAITGEGLTELARELLISNQLRLAVVGPINESEPLQELLVIK